MVHALRGSGPRANRGARVGLGLLALVAVAALALGCSDPEPADRLEGPPPEGEVAARAIEALTLPDSLDRVAAIAGLLSGLGEEAIPEVVEAYAYARPMLGDSEWMILADWWTRHQPREAYGWVLSSSDHKTPGVLRYVIAGMVRTDPEGAQLALATLRDPTERRAAFHEMVKSWHDADPDAALDYLVGLTAGADRQRAIEVLVGLMLRRDGIEATEDWAEGLDDDLADRFKLQVYRRVASELALVDFEAAKAWAEEHADGEHGDGLYRRVAARSITTHPKETMEWLRTRPAGDARAEAIEDAFRRWTNDDRDAAGAWLESAPPGDWQQPALETYALSFGVEDPLKAIEMLQAVEDEGRRNYGAAKVVIAWFSTDRPAAEAWLAQADLPEEVELKIRDRVRRNDERREKMEMRAERRRLRKQERGGPEQP